MAAPDPQRLGQVGEDGVLRQVLGRYAPPPDWLRVGGGHGGVPHVDGARARDTVA